MTHTKLSSQLYKRRPNRYFTVSPQSYQGLQHKNRYLFTVNDIFLFWRSHCPKSFYWFNIPYKLSVKIRDPNPLLYFFTCICFVFITQLSEVVVLHTYSRSFSWKGGWGWEDVRIRDVVQEQNKRINKNKDGLLWNKKSEWNIVEKRRWPYIRNTFVLVQDRKVSWTDDRSGGFVKSLPNELKGWIKTKIVLFVKFDVLLMLVFLLLIVNNLQFVSRIRNVHYLDSVSCWD